jgi:site-specific recombinase XerD
MESTQTIANAPCADDLFPTLDEIAALRAWYEGIPARQAATQYLQAKKATGQSSRSMLGAIRRRLAAVARSRHRDDLAALFEHSASERADRLGSVFHAIDDLGQLSVVSPRIDDEIERWLPSRAVGALARRGIGTLAALTLAIPRRRRWWTAVPGLGAVGARGIDEFFAKHPELVQRARDLIVVPSSDIAPWERLVVPHELDGSQGVFRADQATCTLSARNDYQAVQAWIELQESAATQRAYRKEAERLMLWAIDKRGKALSSLTTEDAIAYRQFLRKPTPKDRWVGPARPRASGEWRPFQGVLAPRSAAYALSVVGGLFRWLIQQRYSLANPFAGVKVKGAKSTAPFDSGRAFNNHEWSLIRPVAEDIAWVGGWNEEAAQRLRFVLDFWYATGLRPDEMVKATLGSVRRDDSGDDWLDVVGKGNKKGSVALPLAARGALDRYLASRGLPTTRARWNPQTPLAECHGEVDPEHRLFAFRRHVKDLACQEVTSTRPSNHARAEFW